MKSILALSLLAPLATYVSAECASGCSGHGRCTNYKMTLSTASDSTPAIQVPVFGYAEEFGYDQDTAKKDSCTCFSRVDDGLTVYAWTGADCSLRTCPHGQSWDIAPANDNSHNTMAECSDRGSCDRKTGVCNCYPGFTGKSCQRTTCPNDCNGRGECKTLNEIAADRAANTAYDVLPGFTRSNILYSSAWDADRIRGCECDLGYRGADCSLVECPSGADPMGGNGSAEGRVCSGRGSCDTRSGSCNCFKGFFGTRCEHQRANVL